MATRVKATAKYVRVSPTKVRQLTRLIVGTHVDEATRILEFSEKGAAEPLLKVLNSAIANAENNDDLDPDDLFVDSAFADEGPTLKRFQPGHGRAYRIRKRTSYITVIVRDDAPEEKPMGGRSTQRVPSGITTDWTSKWIADDKQYASTSTRTTRSGRTWQARPARRGLPRRHHADP